MMRNGQPIHFCDDPRVALCGVPLVGTNKDFKLFYDNTSSSFAQVSCSKCREELRRTRFSLAGWPDPEEWSRR